VQQAAVPRQWSTHGGEDVPVYAQGPMAHAFRGVIDQTFIPHAIAYSACVGAQKDRCSEPQKDVACPTDPAAAASSSGVASGGAATGGAAVSVPERKENVSTPHAQRPALNMELANAAPTAAAPMSLLVAALIGVWCR
jgi:hypothetical protein